MEDKNIQWIIVGLLLIVVAGMIFSVGQKQIIVSNDATPKISVMGTAEKEVMPDKAMLSLVVKTEGKTAKEVQDANTIIMNKVQKALKDSDVTDKEMETSGYNLYPWQEYDNDLNKYVDKGYKLSHTLMVTTTDISKVGDILDIAVNNGVNSVNNVQFMLSDVKEKEVKAALIQEASMMAKSKAQDLADSLDVSLGDVQRNNF